MKYVVVALFLGALVASSASAETTLKDRIACSSKNDYQAWLVALTKDDAPAMRQLLRGPCYSLPEGRSARILDRTILGLVRIALTTPFGTVNVWTEKTAIH